MRQLAGLCFVAAAVLAWLEHMDRTSPTALTVVEWSQWCGVPLFILATLIGILLLVFGMLRGARTPQEHGWADKQGTSSVHPPRTMSSVRPPLREASTLPPLEPVDPTRAVNPRDTDWRNQIRKLAQDLQLGKGARVTIDMSTTTPITLHLEHLSPVHCKRAIAAMGSLVSAIPTPPRVQVVFDHCPQAGVPRHHQVAGALAQTVPRGQFRVVSHVDKVDVMFLDPDPAWSAPVSHS